MNKNADSLNEVICIVGPTASGKTKLAIELAQALGAEVVSVDSRQMYRELKIGSAQPTEAELHLVKHYFIADRSIHQNTSAGQFAEEARKLINDKLNIGQRLILVGGAGFYFKALFDGLDSLPDVSDSVRNQVNEMYENQGLEELQSFILSKDTDAFMNVDQNNPARLKRMAEVIIQTGSKYSDLIGHSAPFSVKPIYLGIDLPREKLYQQINQRTELMVESGLRKEVEGLIPFNHLPVLNTVGYKEYFMFFDGKISESNAIELIKKNTRNYAKRQMTWFRNQTQVKWFASPDSELFYEIINGN